MRAYADHEVCELEAAELRAERDGLASVVMLGIAFTVAVVTFAALIVLSVIWGSQ